VNQYLLVLTATVTPFVGAQVQRSDPATRREDYKAAFRFWLNHADPRINRILFLENSGDDLEFLKEIVEQENRPISLKQPGGLRFLTSADFWIVRRRVAT